MKASKKNAVAARDTKRRLHNPLAEAQKSEKVVTEVERHRKILQMAV
jgi:hypothetical protein